jgi:putative tricarboxylic transport membrane protein
VTPLRRDLFGTGVGVGLLALAYLIEAHRYSWGTTAQPGPGLYPTLVGLLLLASAGAVAREAWQRRPEPDADWPVGPARLRVIALLAPTAGYVVALPYLGHPVAGTLLTLAVLHTMGTRRWVVKIAGALAIGVGSHYVFAKLLGVPLPTGIWPS